MESMPTGFGRLLSVAGRLLADPIEVAVLGRNDDPSRPRYSERFTDHSSLHEW